MEQKYKDLIGKYLYWINLKCMFNEKYKHHIGFKKYVSNLNYKFYRKKLNYIFLIEVKNLYNRFKFNTNEFKEYDLKEEFESEQLILRDLYKYSI